MFGPQHDTGRYWYCNRWLRERQIRTHLLAVLFRNEDLLFLVLTARRNDASATITEFKPFEEDSINACLDVGDVEILTMLDNFSPEHLMLTPVRFSCHFGTFCWF